MSNSKKGKKRLPEAHQFKKKKNSSVKRRVIDVREMISAGTIDLIWQKQNVKLGQKTYSTHGRSGFASFCEKNKKLTGMVFHRGTKWMLRQKPDQRSKCPLGTACSTYLAGAPKMILEGTELICTFVHKHSDIFSFVIWLTCEGTTVVAWRQLGKVVGGCVCGLERSC